MAHPLHPTTPDPSGWGGGRWGPSEAGFVLPLAFLGAMALLLGAMGLQALALQSRSAEAIQQLRRQREDALASAAQLVAAGLRRHPCLLPLPLHQWQSTTAELCSREEERTALRRGRLPAAARHPGSYTLLSYTPPAAGLAGPAAAELHLAWSSDRGGMAQGRFRLLLAPGADPAAPPLPAGIRP